MTGADPGLPRERLDSLIGWQQAWGDQLLVQNDRLHLASVKTSEDGSIVFAQSIPDTDPAGSFGGRTLPRGVAISMQGDVYLADPAGARILYTRASFPPEGADPDAAEYPFLSLFTLTDDTDANHPLRLVSPVDLALVPATAAIGQFADALVIGDAQRLIWLDRHHVVVRHSLSLQSDIISLGCDGTGHLHVAITDGSSARLLKLRFGLVLRNLPLERIPHSLYAAVDGQVYLADYQGVWRIAVDDTSAECPVLDDQTQWTPPALTAEQDTLLWPAECERKDSLRFTHIKVDKLGSVGSSGLRLLTQPARLPRPRRGSWIAGPFDGERRGFPWHRIELEAELPPQCRLVISTHVTDFKSSVEQVIALNDWSGAALVELGDTAETLVQRNEGRYLWLKIDAFCNGNDTAAVTGIDIYGPRQSQLSFLPAPFHQDRESAVFLDRFLSLQDQFFAEALATFSSLGAILRPAATPVEFLDWLGSWFDWQFLADWDEHTRREMIATSIRFFKERGTVCGLLRMLRWHTGLQGSLPVILEGYRAAAAQAKSGNGAFWIGGEAVDTSLKGAHHFSVVLPQGAAPDDAAMTQLKRIIDAQKPAHTTYNIVLVRPGVIPGAQASLGIDAILPDTRPVPLGQGQLGTELQTVPTC